MQSRSWGWATTWLTLVISMGAQAQSVDVLTHHYNNARTGLNAKETRLSPATVKPGGFGQLFSHAVDGQLYAQPLYVSKLAMPGKGTRNVVFVATQNDTVYAFDADSAKGSNAQPLWQASLLDAAHGAASGATAVNVSEFGTGPQGEVMCGDIYPSIGVTSTPVIDRLTKTLYVEAKSKENGVIVQRLHALDLTTGQEKAGSPVGIPGAMKTPESFDPLWQLNRPALLLNNQTVYVAFGSHCDGLEQHPYRGWVFSFDASTLAPKAVLPLTRGAANAASIWMSGAGPAADASGQVFAVTGDGDYDGVQNFGDSILKLDGSTLAVKDWFSPPDNAALDAVDADLGSGGTLLLPDQPGPNPRLLVQATKDGRIYLLNRDRLAAGSLVQTLGKGTLGSARPESFSIEWAGLFGLPSYWNQKVYFWGVGDVLKVFSLNNGLLDPTPLKGTTVYPYPGANLAISANGNTGGVLWSIRPSFKGSPALQAWDATTLGLLYSSDLQTGDEMGASVKYTAPVVANGKVFVGGGDRLTVYGRRIKLFGNWVPLY
jgi:outer membrane protein assembly factor BamB